MSMRGVNDCEGSALPGEARRTEATWVDLGLVRTPTGGGQPIITHETTGCDLSYPVGSTGRNLSAHERAISLVDGDRQKAYGPPEDNLGRIGQAWAAVLGLPEPISAFQVALLMSVLKAVRAAHRADEDSVTDLLGYGELAARLR